MITKTKNRITKTIAVTSAFLLIAAGCYAVMTQSQETAFADEIETESTEELEAEEIPEALGAASAESEDQMMRIQEVFTELDTVALDKESETHSAKALKEVTIVDTVTYMDVAPDDDYHLEATLMDKETGEPVMASGKAVTATKAFDPDDYDGTETVEITFDASELGGHDVVVFEKLMNDSAGDVEATHEDINDGDQTVSIAETTPVEKMLDEVPKTGDKKNMLIAGVIAFAALLGMAATIIARRKKAE